MTSGPQRLELRDVAVVRSGARLLDGVSLGLARGEILAVIGPNGAGKSTLLDATVGATPLAAGAVLLDERPPRSLSERARAMAYLAGEAEPAAEARVGVALDEKIVGDDAWARELAARLDLQRLRSARVGTLSRGERRRLMLFEALRCERPFVLLDEPTGVFDPLQLDDVVALLRLAADRGAGILLTVHQMSDAEALGARLVLLNGGRVVAMGSLDELCGIAALSAKASLHDVFVALLRKERAHASA